MKRCFLILTVLSTGCLSKSIVGMTDPMGQVAQTLSAKIADEGVLREWMAEASARLDHPAAVAFIRNETAVGIRMEGVNAEIAGSGGGDSTRLPAGVRAALVEQLGMPIGDSERAAILSILGWNRTPASGTPPPAP